MGVIKENQEKSLFSIVSLFVLILLLLVSSGTCRAASVVLSWPPSTDNDIAGYKVYYQNTSFDLPFTGTGATQGSSPIDVGNVVTTTLDGFDPNTPHYFAVTAYNSAGLESVFSNVITIAELVAPVTSIASPSASASVNGTVSINVNASDNVGVAKVQVFINGSQIAETTAAPYIFSWETSSLASGPYVISAIAFDDSGNEGDATPVSVTVINDTVSPTVAVSNPANNQTVSGSIEVSASASDNVGVTRIEIYLDNNLSFTGNQASASYAWNTLTAANGSHSLYAKAYDAAGNVGTSATVTLNVSNDTSAPVVSIVAPTAQSTLSNTATVTVSASDNVGVTRVELYANGVLLGSDSGAPYSFSWNTLTASNGSYSLSAKAYDAAGNIGSSAPITVNVFNDKLAPSVTGFAMPTSFNSTTVAVTSYLASDNVGVTGYLITESATTPAASATGWKASAPTSFTFSGTGLRTAYAWAKDAAGNVSASSSATVMIDTTLPVIKSISLLRSASTVTIKASAADKVGVTKLQLYIDGALKAEVATGSLSYTWTVSYQGYHLATVKAYDAAGNVRSQTVSFYK